MEDRRVRDTHRSSDISAWRVGLGPTPHPVTSAPHTTGCDGPVSGHSELWRFPAFSHVVEGVCLKLCSGLKKTNKQKNR